MQARPGRYRWRAACGWWLLLLTAAAMPLAVALAQRPDPRAVAVEFGAGLGLLGLGLLVIQSFTSGRHVWVAPRFGADNLAHFHRHLGLLAAPLLLAHPLVLFVGETDFLRFLDPRDEWVRAISLWALLALLLLITVSSLRRQHLGLSYEIWRLLHGGLALLLLLMGLGHALMVGHYFHSTWQQLALVAWVGLAVFLIFSVRILRPWRNRRRPWEVLSVLPERGDCWTLSFRPVGHEGMRFQPGQYAWFTLGDTPFSLQQHPFSLACAAGEKDLCFTAAASGDFTRSLSAVKPGTLAWIEGPMGSFVPDEDQAVGLFLVAGGIGITPMMSMLRTFRSVGDRRRIRLLYANPNLDEVAFFEELAELQSVLNLEVIHVLEEPPPDWSGESGLIDGELLDRCLEGFEEPVQYMTCGPEPVMDLVESGLRQRGVDWRRVFSERFEIV